MMIVVYSFCDDGKCYVILCFAWFLIYRDYVCISYCVFVVGVHVCTGVWFCFALYLFVFFSFVSGSLVCHWWSVSFMCHL